ncbi:hypothetical protein QBC46DRAFT_413079 [Diplogelasinospora grovesii]|uniref:Uncharacterized protein n=1 Tax=Diplogelasinospora grovesii TaxID=303347 RepID=A0AAN6MYQ5_9PEZI|nr:hypothetical protein QBC46DRAFT_413079 [Diplogelasinospora grovesii]
MSNPLAITVNNMPSPSTVNNMSNPINVNVPYWLECYKALGVSPLANTEIIAKRTRLAFIDPGNGTVLSACKGVGPTTTEEHEHNGDTHQRVAADTPTTDTPTLAIPMHQRMENARILALNAQTHLMEFESQISPFLSAWRQKRSNPLMEELINHIDDSIQRTAAIMDRAVTNWNDLRRKSVIASHPLYRPPMEAAEKDEGGDEQDSWVNVVM